MNRILLVDDEPDTHLLYKLKFKRLLKQVDFISFLRARECLDYLQTHDDHVDLIISDINMPEMDGFEFLKRTRSLYPTLPLYIVSAYNNPEYKNKSYRLGAQRFLEKPIDFKQMNSFFQEDHIFKN